MDGTIADLELRVQALEGDEHCIEMFQKESKEQRIETLKSHLLACQKANKIMRLQFDIINEKIK